MSSSSYIFHFFLFFREKKIENRKKTFLIFYIFVFGLSIFYFLYSYFKNSKIPAVPCPVPTHIETIPYFDFLLIAFRQTIEQISFAPVQPSGCPKAIAPPFTFTISGFKPNSLTLPLTIEKQTLRLIQLNQYQIVNCNPACFNAFGIAFTGPIPMILGSTPAEAKFTNRAIGSKI